MVLVDSSKVMHAMVADSLDGIPVTLHSFRTADEADAELEKNVPALLIIGDKIGNKDGLTFLRELRRHEHYKDTPVAMITSKGYMQDQQIAKELGVRAFLIKPVTMQVLRDIVMNNIDAGDGA